jgi:hypothetical protein
MHSKNRWNTPATNYTRRSLNSTMLSSWIGPPSPHSQTGPLPPDGPLHAPAPPAESGTRALALSPTHPLTRCPLTHSPRRPSPAPHANSAAARLAGSETFLLQFDLQLAALVAILRKSVKLQVLATTVTRKSSRRHCRRRSLRSRAWARLARISRARQAREVISRGCAAHGASPAQSPTV